MTFTTLDLHPLLLKAIEKSGYTNPTPIQEKAIPCVLKGDDLLASAQTGTGKTAAFVLPILHKMLSTPATKKGIGPRALILSPTRELAQQISEAARTYAQFMEKASVVSIVGGVPYDKQRQKLRRPIDIMVATPGRLIDYLGQKAIDFCRVDTLVLDEADRMLDMGFVDAVREIADVLPKERQTLLFSATLDKSVSELAGSLLKNPVRVSVTPDKTKHDLIEQSVQFVATQHEKTATLATLLETEPFAKAIVFVATKRSADDISYKLNKQGLRTAALHGDMRQGARNRTVRELSSNEINIVVATDVAARGLDIRDVELVINYDLPRQSEDYVHRIGRTGRAGAKGKAISLAYNKEKRLVTSLEKFLGHQLTKTFSEASKTEEADFKAQSGGARRPERREGGGGGRFSSRSRGGRRGDRGDDRFSGERRSFGKFKRSFSTEKTAPLHTSREDDAPIASSSEGNEDRPKRAARPFGRSSGSRFGGGGRGFKRSEGRSDERRPSRFGGRSDEQRSEGGFKRKFSPRDDFGAPKKSFSRRDDDTGPREKRHSDDSVGRSERGGFSRGGFKKKFGGPSRGGSSRFGAPRGEKRGFAPKFRRGSAKSKDRSGAQE